MSNNFINVSKSSLLILRLILLLILQFIVATLRLKIDVFLADIKLLISLSLSLILLWSEYLICFGSLIGVSLRRDEERFNKLYSKYKTYFKGIYMKLNIAIRQTYSLDQILACKVNM